ncbi:lysophospholipid acyltransferase family protein [bacterium]|nr:lysophospholipid acyltransferase family protein [bacterium]
MITAHHVPLAEFCFHHYLNALFRRHFHALYLDGHVPEPDPDTPLLILPNHSSWWDGFFIFFLNRRLFKRKIYLMMLEEQLRQNRFFRLLGAYSIDPGRTGAVRQSLLYTRFLLNRSGDPPAVCVFPQGVLLPWQTRPVTFQPGVDFILRHLEKKIQISLLGIRIEMLNQQRPDVFFRFSPLQTIRPGDPFSVRETSLILGQMLDAMAAGIVRGKRGMCLFQGLASANDRFRIRKQPEGGP